MSNAENRIVGISVGDLNGIGTEIILKTFKDNRMLDFCTPVIFASTKLMGFFKRHYEMDVNLHGIDSLEKIAPKKVNVFNVWKDQLSIEFGKEDPEIGAYAIKSLEAAVKALKEGYVHTLVTAPINKSNVQSERFNFPGHTDYLAKELNGNSLMLMVSGTLRIGLLTDHVAVKDVSSHITKQRIHQKVETVIKTLKQDFGLVKPKIAVLGINPHNGDNGVIGNEDGTVMHPALDDLRAKGHLVFGPFAADSFFGSGNYKNFDAIIASYHDQGLIPFKTLSFGKGVNYTAGLSHVRTSPDHGTAYDLAGKNQADETSFKEAVFMSLSVYRTRKEYLELAKDPLKTNRKRTDSKKNAAQ